MFMKMGYCWRFFTVSTFLLAVLSASGIKEAGAAVHEYSNARFESLEDGYYLYGGDERLWASTSTKNGSGVADGKSFLKFDSSLIFTRSNESAAKITAKTDKVTIEAIFFEMADKDNFGVPTGRSRGRSSYHMCCTEHYEESIGCQPGEIIIKKDTENPEWPQSRRLYFTGSELSAQFPTDTIPITKTGFYTLYFVFCEPELEGMTVSGKTVWKNPGGYLPGEETPLYSFFGVMSMAYLALGLVWCVQLARHWEEIHMVQNFITFVIALGMCHVVSWLVLYADFNRTGRKSVGLLLGAVTISAINSTCYRFLILVLSMGYGVACHTLGFLFYPLLMVGALHFAAMGTVEIDDNFKSVNNEAERTNAKIAAYMDTGLFLWVCVSLYQTRKKLKARKLHANLKQYRRFTSAVLLNVFISVCWVGYELYLVQTGTLWEVAWTIRAFWEALHFTFLVVICLLWAPPLIDHSEDVGVDIDEEAVALTARGAQAGNENFVVRPLDFRPL